MICERMLNERESQLREEYDKILNMKLSEQYEAFVKFSNDQLHRRFEAAEDPSCELIIIIFTFYKLFRKYLFSSILQYIFKFALNVQNLYTLHADKVITIL